MRPNYYLFMLAATILISCKKQTPKPVQVIKADISYKKVNRSVKQSDLRGVDVDINDDGKSDVYFFVQLMANDSGDHLFFATSTLDNNYMKMGPPDDNSYLNAADVIPYLNGNVINVKPDNGQEWSSEFGVLAIRNTSATNIDWTKNWASGQEVMLAVKLGDSKQANYGWIRIKVDKTTETLTVVDCAWNKIADEALIAGVH